MELQIMKLRKAAGYKSRKAFADVLGVSERKLKAWEVQETRITFEDACAVADALKCSLDELAGRTRYVGSYSDARQTELNDSFESLTDSGKDAALGAVSGIRIQERARDAASGDDANKVSA